VTPVKFVPVMVTVVPPFVRPDLGLTALTAVSRAKGAMVSPGSPLLGVVAVKANPEQPNGLEVQLTELTIGAGWALARSLPTNTAKRTHVTPRATTRRKPLKRSRRSM
jgi:hypothetical protein